MQHRIVLPKYWRFFSYPLCTGIIVLLSFIIGAPVSYLLLYVMAIVAMVYFVFQEAIIHYYLKEFNEIFVVSIILLVISAYITKI